MSKSRNIGVERAQFVVFIFKRYAATVFQYLLSMYRKKSPTLLIDSEKSNDMCVRGSLDDRDLRGDPGTSDDVWYKY